MRGGGGGECLRGECGSGRGVCGSGRKIVEGEMVSGEEERRV